jgi:hypothetical protein
VGQRCAAATPAGPGLSFPAGPASLAPAGPASLAPAGLPVPRLLSGPRLGHLPLRAFSSFGTPAGPSARPPGWAPWPIPPGWALWPIPPWLGAPAGPLAWRPGWAAIFAAPRLGRIRRIRPGRDFPPGRHSLVPAGPDYNTPAGPPFIHCSGWARQGSLAQAGLSPW